jgi:hypothetical protein
MTPNLTLPSHNPQLTGRLAMAVAALLLLALLGSILMLWPTNSPPRRVALQLAAERPATAPSKRTVMSADERLLWKDLQAERFDEAHGVKIENGFVSYLNPGDWLCFRQIDFGSGATHLVAKIAVHPDFAGREIELRLGSLTADVVARLKAESTGGWFTFTQQVADISGLPQGRHDVYLTFSGGVSACNIDWIKFIRKP